MSIMSKARPAAAVAAVALAAVSMAGTAHAVSRSCTSATTYSLSDATDAECFSGNDTNQIDKDFSLFGMTGWILAHKNDKPDGDQKITFTDAPGNGTQSGDWAVSGLADKTVITLKAGNGFGAFLLDKPGLSGLWETGKGLSHASIYYIGTPSEVPLPAAGLLLLGGLGGLGLVGRRRRGIA